MAVNSSTRSVSLALLVVAVVVGLGVAARTWESEDVAVVLPPSGVPTHPPRLGALPGSAPHPLPTWKESAPPAQATARVSLAAPAEQFVHPVTTQARSQPNQLPAWAAENAIARRLPADDEDLLTLPDSLPPAVAPAPAAETQETAPEPEPAPAEIVEILPGSPPEADDSLLLPENGPAATPPQAFPKTNAPTLTTDDDDLLTPPAKSNGAPPPSPPPAAAPADEEDLLTPPPVPSAKPSLPGGLLPSPPIPAAEPNSAAANAAPSAPHGPQQPDPHWALFAKNCYPSARECATCHQQHFEEWSCSSHAYAYMSPMFHRFEEKINALAQGTLGYFCLRCHSGVGVAMGMRRDVKMSELPAVAREGVTCIVCHRVNQHYGKVNGERHIVPGPLSDPIYGPLGGSGVAQALSQADHFKVKTQDDKRPGQVIHREGKFFDQLDKAEFCASCHQVAVNPGIKLEVVWEQYRASPARQQGVTCQDCHMGKVPGKAAGYNCGPLAIMNGKAVHTGRKHSNHVFHGPGYSIAHPGIFPINPKADRWTVEQWLEFDWRAGWGTKEFEDQIARGYPAPPFPACWKEADDRLDAREIIDANLKLLAVKRQIREQVMENGSHLDGPFFDSPAVAGRDLKFHFDVTNTNPGHNLLTASLGAQPQLWLNVALVAPNGCTVWESGYTDQYGDVADIHSEDVRHKRLPFDSQLFNLQTMFLITNVKGPDREFPLPVNVDFDQLPFIRPGNQPISVLNHPPFIRMEARSISPLGSRQAKYHVPAKLLTQPGEYRLTFRMRSRLEPLYFMRFCETTPENQRAMNEGMMDVHRRSVQFMVR